MEKQMENEKDIIKIMFELLRFEICGQELSAETKKGLSDETLKQLYVLSKRHDLAHLIADALDKNGLLQEKKEIAEKFETQRQLAVYRYEQMQYEFERICATLEEAEIPYMPLKGAVLRAYYPEPWMRTSCDIDILVKEENLAAAIEALVEKLQYKNKGKAYHDVSLIAPSGIHLELHFNIKENIKDIDILLEKVWEYSSAVYEKQYRYIQTVEYLIYHIVAHTSYHFLQGGCGIRAVLDLWLLRNKCKYDEEQVISMCRKSGVEKFFNTLICLSAVWFSKREADALVLEMQDFILKGGIYGTAESGVAVQRSKKGGRIRYICTLLFLPYDIMKITYPILNKHKWLLPFCWAKRWVKILFRGISKETKRALQINTNVTKGQEEKISELLQKLGLK